MGINILGKAQHVAYEHNDGKMGGGTKGQCEKHNITTLSHDNKVCVCVWGGTEQHVIALPNHGSS